MTIKVTHTPATAEEQRQRMSGTIHVEMTDEHAIAWLNGTLQDALNNLLSDPRPLVYGDDGRLHYVEGPET